MQVGGNAAWLVGERLVHIVVGLLVTAWVARHLDPGLYGKLSFAVACTALLLSLDQMSSETSLATLYAASRYSALQWPSAWPGA